MRPLRAAAVLLAASLWLAACAKKRPPPAGEGLAPDAGQAGAGALKLGDAGDGPSGLCGSQTIPATSNPPNLSFIIDHSASMGDLLAGSSLSKYENARIALSHVLKAVGHRVNYGAAVFPGWPAQTGCDPGVQLLKVQPGDDPSYARQNKTGPILKDLLGRLTAVGVEGGTPAAATLEAMLPVLAELTGPSYAVLITDGAPNCNADLDCTASQCIPNIEGLTVPGMACSDDVNCCVPTQQNPDANLSCVDGDASLAAVTALAEAGIGTFVVGMPGSEPYEDLLNAMAEAGTTARDATPKYYSVGDTEELEGSLKAIAASVAITCDLAIDYEPPDPDFVNVYFDGQVVEYDPSDGWEWTEDGHVAIRGTACEQLSAGDVLEVQILAGCKTRVK